VWFSFYGRGFCYRSHIIRRMIFAMKFPREGLILSYFDSHEDLHEEKKKRILFVVQDEFYVVIDHRRSSDDLIRKGQLSANFARKSIYGRGLKSLNRTTAFHRRPPPLPLFSGRSCLRDPANCDGPGSFFSSPLFIAPRALQSDRRSHREILPS